MFLFSDTVKQIISRTVMAVVLLLLQGTPYVAFAREFVHILQFAKGERSTTVSGSALRGDTKKYVVRAKAGQKMTVKVDAVEDNVAFQIHLPEKEQFLAGAGNEDDAKSWDGVLPLSGKYMIVVGSIRGNGTYKLKVTID